jgi:hypothetical protein
VWWLRQTCYERVKWTMAQFQVVIAVHIPRRR